MNTFPTLAILLLPIAVGTLLVRWLTRRTPLSKLLTLALGFGVGTGILTNLFILLNYVGIPNRMLCVNVLLAVFGLILLWLCVSAKLLSLNSIVPECPDVYGLIAAVAAGCVAVFIIWCGLNIPIISWDTFETMGLKSKGIYFRQSLKHIPFLQKYDYPLHVPIVMAWISRSIGVWDNISLKIIFPLASLCTAAVVYCILRLMSNMRWALFGTALYFASGFLVFHSTIAYRDVTMMYFNCSTVLLILLWQKQDMRLAIWLPAIFSGLTSFIKLEGFGYMGMHNVLVLVMLIFARNLSLKEKVLRQIAFSGVSIGIYLIFAVYKWVYILPAVPDLSVNPTHFNLNSVALAAGGGVMSRILKVAWRYWENMFLSGNWNLLWLLFALSCLRIERILERPAVRYLLLFLAMYFSVYFLAYSLTQHFVWVAEKHDVLSRSILHIFPLVPVGICLINADKSAA